MWSGMLTLELGAGEAKGFTDRHEDGSGNPVSAMAQDLFNNRVGRAFAAKIERNEKPDNQAALSNMCLAAVNSGELVVGGFDSPDDYLPEDLLSDLRKFQR